MRVRVLFRSFLVAAAGAVVLFSGAQHGGSADFQAKELPAVTDSTDDLGWQ